ncbi:MAG: V-type ATP synthase subunit A, partial [Verrucomicrobia bacterium]|nr:V-type ATP synthase subunit A [Verrucomicrobiota bacterium]
MSENTGIIVGVNGNLLKVEFDKPVIQNEVAYACVGDLKLKAEVIRIRGNNAELQVFEDTVGIKVGDPVEFTGTLLSVELGPGLLTQVFDGLQNPLPALAEECGFFLQRGKYLKALPRDTQWAYTPKLNVGDTVVAGDTIGTIPEGLFEHRIMVPFGLRGKWTVEKTTPAGEYTVEEVVAILKDDKGNTTECKIMQLWPVKMPIKCYSERLRPTESMATK